MASNIFPQAPDSFSQNPTVVSIRSEPLLELGQRLVKELGESHPRDTLGRWMAHYIAELIVAAETASTEDRGSKMTLCADAILALWKHRHELPSGKRPFEDFEPIFRALESLDPDSHSARYFRLPDLEGEKDAQNSEAKKWLDTAEGLDRVARILVGHCLARAAATASPKVKEYLALAEAAALTETIDLRIIRTLSEESDSLAAQNLNEQAKTAIEDKIRRLEAFTEFAVAVASDLRQQLNRDGESASS